MGSYGKDNVGDDAILISTLDMLKKAGHNLKIIVFSDRISWKKLRSNDIENRYGVEFHNPLKISKLFRTLKILKNSDLFVLGGGGLIQDKTSIYNLFIWNIFVLISIILNKKTICYAIGVGPLNTRFGKFISRKILNKIKLITVRDNISKKILIDNSINKPQIRVTADPVLFFDNINKENGMKILRKEGLKENKKMLIGVSIFYWFHTKKYIPVKFVIKNKIWKKKETEKFSEYCKKLAYFFDDLASKYNAKIIFISMKKTDKTASYEVINHMKKNEECLVLEENHGPSEMRDIIANMDLLIGQHLHSLILAANANVPIFGIIYDPKIIGFMQLLDMMDYTESIEDFDPKRSGEKIDLIKRNEDNYRKSLLEKTINLKKKAKENIQLLITFLDNK
jgi:polysaccharide pyruvyl transferase CsaB